MGTLALIGALVVGWFLFLRGTNAGVYRTGKLINERGEDITANFSKQERQWAPLVASISEMLSVPPDLALAVMAEESNGDPEATRSTGEVGLFQVKPAAAQDVARLVEAVNVPAEPEKDPQTNSRQGIGFLALQKRRWENEGAGSWWNAHRAFRVGFRASMQDPRAGLEDTLARMQKAGREDLIPQRFRGDE